MGMNDFRVFPAKSPTFEVFEATFNPHTQRIEVGSNLLRTSVGNDQHRLFTGSIPRN